MIKVLLFDFYGVFLPDSYNVWLSKNGSAREGIFADLIKKRDKGEISEPDFLFGLSDVMGREVTIDEIHPKDVKPDKELIDLIRRLKENYKVCLLSNASPRLYEKLEQLAIIDIFDEIILSSEIGYSKPSDKAFEIAIKRVGVQSGEILFIDDNAENIEAALRNDMLTCHYASIDNFREAIQLFSKK